MESTVVRMRAGVSAGDKEAGDVHLASVETDHGPIVIAMLEPADWPDRIAPNGAAVLLTMDAAQRIHASRAIAIDAKESDVRSRTGQPGGQNAD
ncbi:hypothetical protein [Robbsia andropogonis]|uniref:hypothetical protein n=1 Tax=Robbsia andropogonis TaxID=28092 RepID=UPI000687E315|nr:hypothetical protein [Robbsia andropogonis]MCP1116892.1 hypothetical protein [Robbsia andropogonis]MCP1126429.1 hypothetical protein [Robbsia andropogonis]